jgi:hypothetical protein
MTTSHDLAMDRTKNIIVFFAPAIALFVALPATYTIEQKVQFVLDYWIIIVLIYLLYLTKDLSKEK